ncbi:MAG TPA: HD domain-containing phosphohydrolase [Gemmatimonadota bacterium]|nr:HD domain-containing phosphohydrolase [Gemmatimonadota bacterium]
MRKRSISWGSPLTLALAYLVLGALWIAFSDRAASALAGSRGQLETWQLYKGWVFVVASSAVIFLLARAFMRRGQVVRKVLSRTMDLLPDPAVVRRRKDDVYLVANRAFLEVLGRPKGEVEGRAPHELGLEFDPDDWREYTGRLAVDELVRNYPLHVRLPDGSRRTWLASSAVEQLDGTSLVVATTKDVTDLEASRLHAESQVRRILALREIDVAITASLDLSITLNVVLDQVLEHLEVDAADVLLLNEATRRLEFAAGRGFRTDALRHTTLALGEGYAGQAARDRSTLVVPDLRAEPNGLVRSPDLQGEGFTSYAAVALVAKGRVNGVIEVFNRAPLAVNDDWQNFLEVLAGQAAIAVDNASLLADLQRSNERLSEAYEHTIEGWAQALALRDHETYGHTERVTEVTVRLARRLGLPDEDIVHVRRGALLHDIGKVGVPDAILLKPGPLDEDEWRVMRQHPVFAYDLLAPIEHLRPALDIPYCHHEKWDGSGYPRNLAGEQIPRAARIFAVVDVWDALRSDRPYREAWEVERTLEHIRAQAGTHFDPKATEAFLHLHRDEDLERLRGNGEISPGAA